MFEAILYALFSVMFPESQVYVSEVTHYYDELTGQITDIPDSYQIELIGTNQVFHVEHWF